MKKAITLLFVLFFINCSKNPFEPEETPTPTPTLMYDTIYVNNTSYNLTITDSIGNNFDAFTVNAGQTKTITSTSSYDSFSISHNSVTHIIDYKREYDPDKVIFYQYEYLVEYKITGTAITVDTTLNNQDGGTEQYSDVSIPHTYSYKTFPDWFLYISAQNQGDTGSVTVTIYYKGELFKTSTSEGAYVIATASGSK